MGDLHRFAFLRRRAAAVAAFPVLTPVSVALIEAAGDGGPPLVSGTPAEAGATVDAFQRALRTRDFAKICDRLFSTRAREAAGGDNCQSVLAQASSGLRRPRVRITSVALARGGHATVGVVARAKGSRGVPEAIRLGRQRGRFRIASAGA